MGIAPYKTFTFDGKSSADFGVYLTGEGVFNAPERAVEMLEIPGRNGKFALDQGRFENIEVTYKAGMFDVTEANFASKIEAFRNWLCSKVGYVRLSDDYNPNEYRMAVYSKGVKVDHDFLIAGEFEITFNCKPQRWLTSGETAVSVASGGTLTNPTLFDASPLLEVYGYGDIDIGGQEISINNVTIGKVIVFNGFSRSVAEMPSTSSLTLTLDTSALEPSNEIVVDGITETITFTESTNIVSVVTTTASGMTETHSYSGKVATFNTNIDAETIEYGTSKTWSAHLQARIISNGGNTTDIESTFLDFSYDGAQTITVTFRQRYGDNSSSFSVPSLSGTSTRSIITDTIHIDCDIGECWMETNGGTIVSLNDVISLGSDLPTLAPGTNTFSYPNTVTSFEVIPRWWKV